MTSQYIAVGNMNFPFMDDYDILFSLYRKSILHLRLQFYLSRRILNRLLDIELYAASFLRQIDVCVIKRMATFKTGHRVYHETRQ